MIWSSVSIIAALPIGLYFLHHPEDFLTRAKQVSIFTQPNPLGAFWTALFRVLGQFNIKGDCWWLVNIGCSPILLLPVGLLFAVGVVLAFRAALLESAQALPYWLLLIWFPAMLLPAVLAGGASALRSIGAVPPVFIFAGIAAEFILAKLEEKRVACILFFLMLITCSVIEAYRYFYVWARDPQVAYEFDASNIEIGRFLNSLPQSTPRYVVVNLDDDDVRISYKNSDSSDFPLPISVETILFKTHGHPSPTLLFEEDVEKTKFVPGSVIVQLYWSPQFFRHLQTGRLGFRTGIDRGVHYVVVE
jgi:hypothetical protein